jgi:hypothetical protein
MRSHYPGWDITVTLPAIFKQIADAWRLRKSAQ